MDTNSSPGRVAFWIAHGQRYIAEAQQSAASLAVHSPAIERVLFCDQPEGIGSTMALPPRRHPERWYLDAARFFQYAVKELAGFGQLLYLDTDTYVCAPVDDVFDLLTRCDFVGAHAPGRVTAKTVTPVPDAFPEVNVGVLALRNCQTVREMLQTWVRLYERYPGVYGNNDQAPLREALWAHSQVRLGILPPEYNFRFLFGGQVNGKVKVLHGRRPIVEQIARAVNAEAGIRAWRKGELR